MSRAFLSRGHRRYIRISPESLYETPLQSIVDRNLRSIFPDYFGGRFEPYLRTIAGDVKPDLVMARNDLNGWALIEVESDHHSVYGHILPQLSKLARASANERLIQDFQKRYCPQVPINSLVESFFQPPRIFLVTHGSSASFRSQVEELGVEPIDIDVYLSPPNEYILVVEDRTKELVDLGLVAIRSRSQLTRNIWVLAGRSQYVKALLPGDVLVTIGDSTSLWRLSETSDGYLMRSPADLTPNMYFEEANVYANTESGALELMPKGGSQ